MLYNVCGRIHGLALFRSTLLCNVCCRIHGLLCWRPGDVDPSGSVVDTYPCGLYSLVWCRTHGLQQLLVMAFIWSVQGEIFASCSENAQSRHWSHWGCPPQRSHADCYRYVCQSVVSVRCVDRLDWLSLCVIQFCCDVGKWNGRESSRLTETYVTDWNIRNGVMYVSCVVDLLYVSSQAGDCHVI